MDKCAVQNTINLWKKTYNVILSLPEFIQNNQKMLRITGEWYRFMEKAFSWWRAYDFVTNQETAQRIMKELDTTTKSKLISDIHNLARKTYNDKWFSPKTYLDWKQTGVNTPLADWLRSLWYDSKVLTTVERLEELFNNYWWASSLDMYKIWMSMSHKTWLLDVYNNITWSLKYAFLTQPWVDINDLSQFIRSVGIEWWIQTEKWLKFLEDSVLATPIGTWRAFKFVWALKQLYSHIKYSPITSAIWWSLMLLNNMVNWTALLMSRKRWLEWILDNDIIDLLWWEIYWILKSQNKALSDLKLYVDTQWKNMYFRFIDKFTNSIPFLPDKAKAYVNAILQWWVHTARDMGAENYVKRVALAQALSRMWINKNNIEALKQWLKEKNISETFMQELSWHANIYYHTFFWNSNLTTLNRNMFSRRWFINTLQWYVLGRSAEMIWAVRQFSRALKEWKIKTRWDFIDYIHTDNQELKSLLNNILLAWKMSIYADYVANDKEYEWNVKQPYKYMLWMSDYISSLQSTFYYRLLTAPLEWADDYLEYTAATWKSENVIEWISVSAMKTLAEAMRMLFREWNVINIFADAWLSYLKTWDLDFATDVAWTNFDKIANGMWRYMLLPNVDTYWQMVIPEDDDLIWRIFFTYDKTNNMVRESWKLRNMSDIDSMLNDKSWYTLRLLQYLPILKWFTETSKSTGRNEARYKRLQDLMEEDLTLKDIWNWELPEMLLNNRDITNTLYRDLTAFDYSYKKYKWQWEHDVWTYWLNKMEETVFIDNIAKQIYWSTEAMDADLLWKSASTKNLLKVIAAANAQTPWSSRIILSYLAAKEYSWLKEQLLWSKYVKSADIPQDIQDEIERMVVSKYYPLLYTADKTSQYKVVREYLSYVYPDIYKWIENDNELNQLVNSMSFIDMMVMDEWNKWNVDANYIKNIFNLSAKYITNDADRVAIVNHTLWTINWLKNAWWEQKQLMKIWVLGSNIWFYDKLKKDPITSVLYKDDIDRFERIVWDTNDAINMVWNNLAVTELNEEWQRQYYWTKWYRYTPKQEYYNNKKLVDDFQDKFNKVYKPIERPYQRNNTQYSNYNPRDIWDLTPKRYRIYAKFYEEQLKAFSKSIVEQWQKTYPAEWTESLKFTIKERWAGLIPKSKWLTFVRNRKKYPSTKTLNQFPGGTDDISSD